MGGNERTPIIGFVGRRGDGKSLLMSVFALAQAQSGDTIFANYGLSLPNTTVQRMDAAFLKSFFDTKGEAFLRGRNATICIDELTTFLDAYEHFSKPARIFNLFVLQSRKRSVSIFYTAQQMNLVPIRIRNNTDLLIHPTYDKASDVLTYTIHQYEPPHVRPLKTISIRQASRFFALYDSNQIIDVLEK